MRSRKIDPMEYPREKGEPWWIVHPNHPKSEFILPVGAVTICQKDFECFQAGKIYQVEESPDKGWIRAFHPDGVYDMPQYLFARHFDAEAFVRGVLTEKEQSRLKQAKPYPYTPTLPPPPKRQITFEDYIKEKDK